MTPKNALHELVEHLSDEDAELMLHLASRLAQPSREMTEHHRPLQSLTVGRDDHLPLSERLSPEEWEDFLASIAVDPSIPALSDEATKRESIYEGR